MRATTRLLSAAALTGVLALSAAPIATADALPTDGLTRIIHKKGYGDVTAHCPVGYHATGGGVAVDHKDEVDTLYSRPTQDGRGWEGRALGEVEPPEKDAGKAEKQAKAEKPQAKDEMDRPDEKLHGLPITVYAICSL